LFIVPLLHEGVIARPIKVSGVSQPTQELIDIIQEAVRMPTTLWFNLRPDKQKAEIEALSIAGQATICFNLMQYINEQYGDHPATYPPAIQDLWNTLQKDWKTLNDTPRSLLDKLLDPSYGNPI
jgi:N-methylhydantoinase B/oxoprolinase/acetone carboxylase alpha subunit